MYQRETIKPYTSKDTTWVEEAKGEKAANARPGIKAPVENMEQYEYIFPNYFLKFCHTYKVII